MTQEQVEQLIGKKITQVITFPAAGEFEAYYAATDRLSEMGISAGSMQRGAPIGLAYGDAIISKWRGLGEDVKNLDGLLIATDGSFRNGSVTIYLADKPEA